MKHHWTLELWTERCSSNTFWHDGYIDRGGIIYAATAQVPNDEKKSSEFNLSLEFVRDGVTPLVGANPPLDGAAGGVGLADVRDIPTG